MRLINYFYIIPFFTQILWAECSDLEYADCIYWSAYCEWDDDNQECYEKLEVGEEKTYCMDHILLNLLMRLTV